MINTHRRHGAEADDARGRKARLADDDRIALVDQQGLKEAELADAGGDRFDVRTALATDGAPFDAQVVKRALNNFQA